MAGECATAAGGAVTVFAADAQKKATSEKIGMSPI
jgi:hypothetical protein